MKIAPHSAVTHGLLKSPQDPLTILPAIYRLQYTALK